MLREPQAFFFFTFIRPNSEDCMVRIPEYLMLGDTTLPGQESHENSQQKCRTKLGRHIPSSLAAQCLG